MIPDVSVPDDRHPDEIALMEQPEPSASPMQDAEVSELELLRREVEQNYDRYLRALAEQENIRKRARSEIEAIRRRANEDLAEELLPVLDNLALALTAASEQENVAGPFVDGVRLVHKQLVEVLGRHGCSVIETVGKPFDPALHEAAMISETTDGEDGIILEVIREGYTMGGKVLRPALVKVSKKV